MANFHFSWIGSGLGESSFSVSGWSAIQRLRVRYEATDYQRSISSYSDADWQRDVVGAIDLLVSESPHGQPIPPAMVDEFNAWREAEYWSHRRSIDSQPDRYGVVDWDSDPVFKRPRPVRGARYLVRWNKPGREQWRYGCKGLGWWVNGEAAPAGADGEG
jgi:hypothetical protein